MSARQQKGKAFHPLREKEKPLPMWLDLMLTGLFVSCFFTMVAFIFATLLAELFGVMQ